MYLQTNVGAISNLKITSTKQDILYSPGMRKSAAASAIVFGIAGLGAAALQTSQNADDTADDVNIYSFEMNGVYYSGVTRRATFKNGDEIDLVYEAREHGNEVLGIRRPSTRSIWLYPYMSCGSTAAVLRAFHQWLKWGSGFGISMLLIASLTNLAIGKGLIPRHSILDILIISYLVATIGLIWLAPRFLRFAKAADEVFAAMGYEKPKTVNLLKISDDHRKKHNITWTIKNNLELWY